MIFVAFQFQIFEMLRYYGDATWMWMIINTVISSSTASIIVNPLEVLLTRYALVDTNHKKLVFRSMVAKMCKEEGFRGFYKGSITEAVGHSLYALFWLPLYQYLRESNEGFSLGE